MVGTRTVACSVVAFPLGYATPAAKASEAEGLVRLGCGEIDMVVNIAALLEGDDEFVQRDVGGVVAAVAEASEGAGLVKVILETGYLDAEQIGRGCALAVEGGEGWHSKWDRNRQRALERAGHRCEKCGSTKNVQVHHKRKVTDGGTDSLRNLIVLCQACHSEKHPPPDWMAQMMKSGKWKKGKRVKRRATIKRGTKPGFLQRLSDMF